MIKEQKKNYYHERYYNGWLAMFELLTLDHFAEGFLISFLNAPQLTCELCYKAWPSSQWGLNRLNHLNRNLPIFNEMP